MLRRLTVVPDREVTAEACFKLSHQPLLFRLVGKFAGLVEQLIELTVQGGNLGPALLNQRRGQGAQRFLQLVSDAAAIDILIEVPQRRRLLSIEIHSRGQTKPQQTEADEDRRPCNAQEQTSLQHRRPSPHKRSRYQLCYTLPMLPLPTRVVRLEWSRRNHPGRRAASRCCPMPGVPFT